MFGAVVDEMEGLGDTGRFARMLDIRRRKQALLAEEAALVSAIERSVGYAIDGHGSVAAWVRTVTNCSPGEATNIVRLARLTHEHPTVGEALHDGRLGVAQSGEVARVFRNPRLRDQLTELLPIVLDPEVVTLPFPDFKACLRRFELLADPDGPSPSDDSAHDARTADVTELAGGVLIHAAGPGVAGLEMIEIFERFRQAEFTTDWEQARLLHGDNVCAALLARTEDQRRFDALHAIFVAAATGPVDGKVPEPVVNIVIDQATFEAHLAAMLTDGPVTRRDPGELFRTGRCETTGGTPVRPAEAVAAALVGHVRRVVFDSVGTVIDLGRTRRLFTGSARQAVKLQSNRCIWPGCHARPDRCQVDHAEPWAAGGGSGSTSPGNGDLACPRHNRFKNRGFATRRDAGGRWHTYRPDGTELDEPPLAA